MAARTLVQKFKVYTEVNESENTSFSFVESEHKIISFWREKNIFQKSLEQTKNNDSIKTKYALDNGIKLIRIPYWDYDNIEEILEEAIYG